MFRHILILNLGHIVIPPFYHCHQGVTNFSLVALDTLLVLKVCWLIWCPSVLIKVIAGPYCFENLLLLVVLFCFVVVKICYLHLSAVYWWLFPCVLLACVFVSKFCLVNKFMDKIFCLWVFV